MKAGRAHSIALCQGTSSVGGDLALCQVVSLEGKAPEWVELIPAGAEIRGRDGRRFFNRTPQKIVEAFAANNADLPLDWEHSTEKKAPLGEPAPAAAWITQLEVRDGGSIWGKLDWTALGAQSVESKAYRYLSPAFYHDQAKNIIALANAGLTNSPNLHLRALNRAGADEELPMNREELIALLGLAATATDDEIKTALHRQKAAVSEGSQKVATLTKELDETKGKLAQANKDLDAQKATNSVAVPSLDKYVPRADYELALNKAKEAQDKLDAQDKAAHDAEIDAEIRKATEAGKITPATVEYHKAQCQQEGGLERFKKFVEAAPVVAAATNSGLDGKTPPATGKQLTEDQKVLCAQMGLTEEEFLATA